MSDVTPTGSAMESRPRPSRLFGRRIIKQGFQLKFSLLILGFLALAAFVIWLEGHIVVRKLLESNAIVDESAALQLELLNGLVAKTSIIGLAVVFGLSLFFSYFVAGPIYRFEKMLEDMRNGDISGYVKLRKHDEFKEVADLFNQMLASLRNRVKKERETVHTALEKIAASTGENPEVKKAIADLRNTPPQIKI